MKCNTYFVPQTWKWVELFRLAVAEQIPLHTILVLSYQSWMIDTQSHLVSMHYGGQKFMPLQSDRKKEIGEVFRYSLSGKVPARVSMNHKQPVPVEICVQLW